ncbi:MAG TPA: phospho-sugar mutase [Sporichthyaceae bacterium]|jgi:phosphomannomutase
MAAVTVIDRARAWIDGDPDADDRAQLAALTDAAVHDPVAAAELADRVDTDLAFGTAGLRGPMAAGPNRMNRAVVIRATAGLAVYLTQHQVAGPVVIGHDARWYSDVFAADVAAVLRGANRPVLLLPPRLPTPVLAFAVRHLGAAAGVMVTASHNPAADNGYKVYLADGAQLAPPIDAEIAALIAASPAAVDVPRDDGAEQLGDEVARAYLDRAVGLLDPGARGITVVHTALHGVAGEVFHRAWAAAGFPDAVEVAEQAAPDPTFPTVRFPNPEEPGALDLARARALDVEADLVLAHDPDGDRCAVMVPVMGRSGEIVDYRRLTGDEVGVLLAEHLLYSRRIPIGGVLATTIVSSGALARLAAAAEQPCVLTPTGFKYLARVPQLAYAYEEALGYCVDPTAVADKDGITAALVIAEMTAQSRDRGVRLAERLDSIAARIGAHVSVARSVPVTSPAAAAAALDALLDSPPRTLAGDPAQAQNLLQFADLPPTMGVLLTTERVRAIVRPSGTEPKLKIYLHAVADPPFLDLAAIRASLAALLDGAGEELQERITG